MDKSILPRSNEGKRPLLHFSASSGWINDPNGLIFFNGQYHLFYQHNPYGCEWSRMHWGHAVSDDMLHWKDLPIALTPDQDYDDDPRGGCFSGSAIEKDGKLFLFYTGSVHREGRSIQTQNIAISEDGVKFTKYENNPVIEKPEGADPAFRDPKIFHHDGLWYIVVGGSIDGDGKVFLYSSEDIFNWTYRGVLFSSDGKIGNMIECPDFFPLGDRWVLLFSPLGNREKHKCLYVIGDMDFETCRFTPLHMQDIDYGFDFYASQTFTDQNGHRIMIAWMNRWRWMPYGPDSGETSDEGWRGALSLPRIVKERDGRLAFEPIEGLSSVFESKEVNSVIVEKDRAFVIERSPAMVLDISFSEEEVESSTFTVHLTASSFLLVDLVSRQCLLITGEGRGKAVMAAPLSGSNKHRIHMVLDKIACEFFLDEGFSTISTMLYEDFTDNIEIHVPYKSARLEIEKEV